MTGAEVKTGVTAGRKKAAGRQRSSAVSSGAEIKACKGGMQDRPTDEGETEEDEADREASY